MANRRGIEPGPRQPRAHFLEQRPMIHIRSLPRAASTKPPTPAGGVKSQASGALSCPSLSPSCMHPTQSQVPVRGQWPGTEGTDPPGIPRRPGPARRPGAERRGTGTPATSTPRRPGSAPSQGLRPLQRDWLVAQQEAPRSAAHRSPPCLRRKGNEALKSLIISTAQLPCGNRKVFTKPAPVPQVLQGRATGPRMPRSAISQGWRRLALSQASSDVHAGATRQSVCQGHMSGISTARFTM